MSLLARPSVIFAIVFGCFAVLIPRIFLPLLRSKPSTPVHNFDDHFQRPPAHVSRNERGDTVEHISGTPPHMRGAHPSMRMHHPGANNPQQGSSDHGSSKSIVTLALPMYTVGIGVFFVYTCCKYWSRKNGDDDKGNSNDCRWKREKRKLGNDLLEKDSEDDEDNRQDLYAGLDSDYIEYLKAKKQKALDAEQAMTEEQKRMHYALEEMKKSLSYISSKLVTKESRNNLHGNEIVQLQERLMSTEAQMCKILSALDTASEKVSKLSRTIKESPKVEKEQEEEQKQESDELHEEESLSSSDEDEKQSDQCHRSSESLSSNNSADEEEQDQTAPEEQNHLIRRKPH
ncbi:unnamed protein product [Adineta ricciae]|uniref:Resistance to inhibitors of cholinesterase protein 3 N-terminal domain-containing protein n=1 Tax=Adineta ricciae TaxID=249248 RepID=A0A815RXM8_ADIRI|nr:unnamed protein product [Adineta ricciae]CAF1481646.1 unnamed protein product [Adineta ricciae]